MATKQLPGNQEDREVYLREHDAASFITAVRQTRRDSATALVMTLSAFAHEPELLYIALDYARHEGVAVTMASQGRREPTPGAAA